MPMTYEYVAIPDDQVPRAALPLLQHALDTYASETNKTVSVWRALREDELAFRPQERSSSVADILKHQLLSERRFFAEFLGLPEPPAAEVLPDPLTVAAAAERLATLARPRLRHLAAGDQDWWLAVVPFFDVQRQRLWIFWRRVLHSAHHRTQIAGYLRLLGRPVPPTYGPTADVTWSGADPTRSVAAAARGAPGSGADAVAPA